MSSCRICDYEGEMKEYDVTEMLYGTKEHFTYNRCPVCDCLQIRDIPKNLGKYYHDDYYSYEKIDGSKKDVEEQEFQVRILDVGCGSGKRISELADMGFNIVHGCDPFIESDIAYENGVKVYKKTIHEMEGQYDLILLMDSFEHVTDPHEVFHSLERLLAPGGNIYISIPVFPNIAFDMFGTSWYQIDAPRHICLHSQKSIRLLAEKYGFDIIKEEWNSDNNQIFRSFLYSKGISFYEQQPEVIKFYFSGDELSQMSKASAHANKNQYGDHALFILARK